MSTTVTYKGSTLTTVENATKTLKTAGKYMEGDVIITDSTYGGGYVWQDQDGYVHLSDDGSALSIEPLSVTQNGTYTAPTGKAYTPVTVNVSGGGPTPPTPTPPTPWVRPSEWPDLSKMDVSGGDIIYMTSYADEARGFCNFRINCDENYTVEVGTISGTTFTAESTQVYSNNSWCKLYYGSVNGTYKVLRVTGTNIVGFHLGSTGVVTIDTFYGYSYNQGIIDVVGNLTSCSNITVRSYNVININIENLVLSGSYSSAFSNCYSLISLDASSWDTSAVTNMNSMFNNCYSLSYLDVGDWDTSKVTNMGNMFFYCYSLSYLDVSKWDTGAVTNMSNMFYGCASLTYLDVSDWDTSKVTNMNSMFNTCKSLTNLDVSDWDTGAVTNMNNMFSSCVSLTYLDVSKWDTSAVTNMGGMFSDCPSITDLDVSDWDIGVVTAINNIFGGCKSLTNLDVSKWDTSAVTNMSQTFTNCYSLISLDVSKWDTSAVTNMSSMFYYCHSLTSLDVSDWDTSAVTNMSQTFFYCYSLTSLDVSKWDTGAVTNMSNMFGGCYSLTSLDVSDWDTSAVTNMGSMFSSCTSIASLDVSDWDTSAVTNMSSMFYYCYSLTSLDVSGWDFSKITSTSSTNNMFNYSCGLYNSITLPASFKYVGTLCFSNCRSLYEWHFLSTTPPTLASTNAFDNMTDFEGKKIYVPSSALTAYQTASNWSTYASYMVGE